MKRSLTPLLAILTLFVGNSCGVMFGGSRYNASIVAKDAPSAEIIVNGTKAGEGTVSGNYRRNRELNVEVRYPDATTVAKTFDYDFRVGNFILSVLSWGIIGLGVDLGTGAAYKPDHRNDPAIERVTDKNYVFTIEKGQ